VVSAQASDTSLIFKWGVRVALITRETSDAWICLADAECRRNHRPIALYGKTSNATRHLRKNHNIISSKTQLEARRRQDREDKATMLRDSPLHSDNPKRLRLLLEAVRIINHSLPFELLDYPETRMLHNVIADERFQDIVTTASLRPAIVDLYASTKAAVAAFLDANRLENTKCMTLVADFWTSKAKSTKFLGLRVYLVGSDWTMKSVLLAARHFNPTFGERSLGIRRPFKRWILDILREFGLKTTDFFGSTTDAGSDVKRMMRRELALNWEWCIAHLTHAATRTAFGITRSRSGSNNPEMTDLIKHAVRTVYLVKSVEVLGSLFVELCEFMEDGTRTRQLLDYKVHRFMGLTRVIERILEKWEPLQEWFAAREGRASGENTAFPLHGRRLELIQILSLLQPISIINRESQREDATQVDVLYLLYRARTTTLDTSTPLRDYRSTHESPAFFAVGTLSPLATRTRGLLRDSFHGNFFSRYTDATKIGESSFVFEMQMLLDPGFIQPLQALRKVAVLCNQQLGVNNVTAEAVASIVVETVRERLMGVMQIAASRSSQISASSAAMARATYSSDVYDLFFADGPSHAASVGELAAEMNRWLEQSALSDERATAAESVLCFWKRQALSNHYRYLPTAARILFALPASSSQIERDFGVAGMMATSQRSSLLPETIDMCSFLSLNRSFVDVTRCRPLSPEERATSVPSSAWVNADLNGDADLNGADIDAVMSAIGDETTSNLSGDEDNALDDEVDALLSELSCGSTSSTSDDEGKTAND